MTEARHRKSEAQKETMGRPRRTLIGVAAATAAAGGIMVAAAAGAATTAGAVPQDKVTLCHFVGEDTWVQLVVNKQTVIGGKSHAGEPNDILPQFIWRPPNGGPARVSLAINMKTDFGGVTGRQIYDNGCVVPAPPTETTSAPPSETVTASESATVTETATETATATTTGGAGAAGGSEGPIPVGVDAGLHTPVSNAGLQAWGIVVMLLGGVGGLMAGLWPSRRRVH